MPLGRLMAQFHLDVRASAATTTPANAPLATCAVVTVAAAALAVATVAV